MRRKFKKKNVSWVYWCMPGIPTLRRLRHEVFQVESSLG
jgi:hypothetical protein